MGLSTSEPIPSGMEYGCRFALPASAQDIPQTVVAIATAIAATDTPVAFVDQGHYDVALNGVIWRLVMFWRDGHRVVTAWWCAPRTEYFEPFVIALPYEVGGRRAYGHRHVFGPVHAHAHHVHTGAMGVLCGYDGRPDAPCPDMPPGWLMVQAQEELDRLNGVGETLLDVMPPWTMLNLFFQNGLHRFYCYEHAAGKAIAAYRYCGMGANGDEGDGGDGGGASEDDGGGGVSPRDETPPGENTNGGEDKPPIKDEEPPPPTPRGGGGPTIPTADDECDQWVGDASSAKANAIAVSINNSNQPVAWSPQSSYEQTIDGQIYRFVMYWAPCPGNASAQCKYTSVYRCAKPKKSGPPKAMISSGALGVVVAMVAAVLGLGALAAASQKKHARAA